MNVPGRVRARLSTRQVRIEDALFRMRYPGPERPPLSLYDVTSSYFDGEHNEMAAFGYNRDGKSGKRQIVVGLLTDHEGRPFSVELPHGPVARVDAGRRPGSLALGLPKQHG